MSRLKYAITTAVTTAVVVSAGVWATLSGGIGASAATPTGPGGAWGVALPVLGLPTTGQSVQVPTGAITALSCTTPGDCGAIGTTTTTNGGPTHPFVVSQVGGTWGKAAVLSGVTGSQGGGGQISCPATGECAAAWTYTDASGDGHAYLLGETGGVWRNAQPVTIGTVSNAITAVSCASAGNCAAVGSYLSGSAGQGLPFIINEADGTWGTSQEAPGITAISSPAPVNATLSSVSCGSPGNCAAAGGYTPSAGHHVAYLIDEVNGTWGAAHLIPGLDSLDLIPASSAWSVSCTGPRDCAAVGSYSSGDGQRRAFVTDEASGTWNAAHEVSPAGSTTPASGQVISCGSPGNCAATGTYVDKSSNRFKAFVANEVAGDWQAATAPAGLPATTDNYGSSVSCPATGNCTVAGYYRPVNSGVFRLYTADADASAQPPVARDVRGTFDGAPLIHLSCTAPGYCSAVGQDGAWPFTVGEATTSQTTLMATTGAVTYGNEQAEKLTITVSSAAGGMPAGTATVFTGSISGPTVQGTPLCTTTLASGTGSCTLPATALPRGAVGVVAIYNGDTNYTTSISATSSSITVATAATVTGLALTTHTLTYGNEGLERITVSVVPQYGGLATGSVTVARTDGSAVCQKSLAHLVATSRATQATCTVPAYLIPGGKYGLVAVYDGDGNFTGSRSGTQPLTVNKAKAFPKLTLSATSARYGHETSVHLTVKVSPQYSGTPTGTVVIKAGSAAICTIKLGKDSGSCTLSATRLKVGTYQLAAAYGGNAGFTAATSPQVTLKITK